MTDIAARLALALAGRYRIERELGAGGMATVYLAHDEKHDRRVAIKVLKPELAAVLGADRFVVEIKTTASLQHPHILPLFDSGTADGFLFYAMPYIDGETLRDRLNRETQLGVEDAVRITSEVADALGYAHRHGVIHRDIKPENILLHDGHVSVADFGIALAVSAAAGGRMTETGLSLGTPHYMSPEQATADKEITGRSDIYSLGAVLYEMLAGDPPHTGSSAQQVIMRIIAESVRPVTEIRRSVPTNVASATAKALQKLPADRFTTAEEFNRALHDPSFRDATTEIGVAAGLRSQRGPWRTVALGFAATTLLLGASLWRVTGHDETPPLTARYAEDMALAPLGLATTRIAISPDGARLVYLGPDSGGQLWVRETGALVATPVRGTRGAVSPFFSPDGKQLAFRRGSRLHVVELGSGTETVLSNATIGVSGAMWASDGWVYSAASLGAQRSQRELGLVRVRPGLDSAEQVTVMNRDAGETDHKWPSVLPGGKYLLFVATRPVCEDNEVAITEIGSQTHHAITKGVAAWWAETGHLIIATADGQLRAARYHPGDDHVTGDWHQIATGLRVAAPPHCAVDVALSQTGALRYVADVASAATRSGSPLTPMWVSRTGATVPLAPNWVLPTVLNAGFGLSRDGTRIAISTYADKGSVGNRLDLFVMTLGSAVRTRLTFDGAYNRRPVWSADGKTITYIKGQPGTEAVWERAADGSTPERQIFKSEPSVMEALWSPRREWLVYRTNDDLEDGKRGDILMVRPGLDRTPRTIVATESEEVSPSLSPDGAWIAYATTSAASSGKNVFVRNFSDPSAGPWQVSDGGGTEPLWSHAGNEIFYRDNSGAMIAAVIETRPTFSVVRREILFDASTYAVNSDNRWYAASLDDRRFLMFRYESDARLIIVDNLWAELRAADRK